MRSKRVVTHGKHMRALIGCGRRRARRLLDAVRGREDRRRRPIACEPTPAAATPSDAEIKTRGIARANEFCEAQGKRAVINVGQSTGWHLFSVQTAEVPVLLRRSLAVQAGETRLRALTTRGPARALPARRATAADATARPRSCAG